MNISKSAKLISYTKCAGLLAVGLVVGGCSSSNPNSGAPAATATKTEARSVSKTAAVTTASEAPKSVFKIDQTSRDPFFPNAKRVVEVAAEPTKQQPQVQMDVTGLLREGFQGVIGSGETRIALINNVMLEPGRQTVIPITAPGQSRSVPVRCREVLRDGVVLEVQGYPEPLRITKAAYN